MLGVPEDGGAEWLKPMVMADPTDGKLVYGLNLSHTWKLEGIAARLPEDNDRRPALITSVATHLTSGLASVPGACPSDTL